MKITRRQEEFIQKMLDLYRESKEPIHYTELAEKLGVNRFTAYDMLRLLEEKGMVSSEYQLAEGKSGPGRSSILFYPTPLANQIMEELTGELGNQDWEVVKEQILSKIKKGEYANRADAELTQEMFARIPPVADDKDGLIAYCLEVMTIIAIRLSKSARRQLLLEYLPEILPEKAQTNLSSLSLLGGFVLGILANEQGDEDWNRELIQHVKQYEQLVADMKPQQRLRLLTSLKEVFAPLIREE